METASLEHLRKLATQAHYNTSFSPEKRGDSIIKEYTEELNNDFATIQKASTQENSADKLQETLSRYQQKYETHLSAWLHSRTGLASSMITGPANFPVARMQKRQRWADNKYEYFREWRQRALKAILKSQRPPANELEKARKNLQDREKMQEIMTAANKIIRNGGPEVKNELSKLGLSERSIHEILTPNWTKKTGFMPYQLSNNNAEIRRLRSRVTVLEAKENLAKNEGEKTEEIDGIKMVHNYQADRVQLFFDGKPDQETISRLKSNGFHWTPSQRAWQRKLTNQAISAAKNVITKGRGI